MFQLQRAASTSLLFVVLLVSLGGRPSTTTLAQSYQWSAACINDTEAMYASGVLQEEYQYYGEKVNCTETDSSITCDLREVNSDWYAEACHNSSGVFYTFDFVSECMVNGSLYRTETLGEPDCLAKSCSVDEVKTYFQTIHEDEDDEWTENCTATITNNQIWYWNPQGSAASVRGGSAYVGAIGLVALLAMQLFVV